MALGSVPEGIQHTTTIVRFNPDFKLPGKLRKKGQHISTDANVSAPAINALQEEAVPLQQIYSFAAPIDGFVPVYLQKQDGRSFIVRLFPISIQPNAP